MTRDGEAGSSAGLGTSLLLMLCATGGLGICAFLLYLKWSDGGDGIAGCGSGGCGEVLSSRWSVVFGVPVALAGSVAYLGLMFSLLPAARRLHLPLLGVLVGAGGWFTLAQVLLLQRFCPWCMTAHGVALVTAGVGVFRARRMGISGKPFMPLLFWTGVSFLSIALMQLYGPVPRSHRIVSSEVPSVSAPVHSRGEGRKISFDEGRKVFDVSGLPLMGKADATHVLVEYFDYQCPACRKMSGLLESLVAKHPTDVAVLLLPVPLDGRCNPGIPLESSHPGSCEIARIALAVWKADPAGFSAFHRGLMTNPSLEEADRLSGPILEAKGASAGSEDPWAMELIEANIADWKALSRPSAKLPKLLIRDRRILHGLPSGEADFIRVMEAELGLVR